jgi:hypothetical protein
MDKVKDIVYLIFVKHLFWTLSVIVILMGFAGWWMSSGNLKKDFDTNHATVTQTKSTIDTIASKPENQIFNEISHDGMKEMNAERRLEVLLAWQSKYDKQRKEVLVWPEGLSRKFTRAIEDLLKGRPIEEVKPKEDGTDHLVFQLREEYRNEIKSLLPKLAEMINAKWDPQSAAARGGRGVGGRGGNQFGGNNFGGRQREGGFDVGGTDEIDEKEYAVWWNPADQGELQATHFDWSHSPDELPKDIEILYSMEDYWVLKALMQIVQRTNIDEETGEVADQPHRAAIREIQSIRIGSSAESNLGQVFIVAGTTPTGEVTEGAPIEGAPVTPTPSTSGEGIEGSPGAVPTGPDPAEGRYVDKAYQPLTAEKLRSAAESGTPEEAYLAVAKRMPVRMVVKMDQRKLNKFLVECGNADLMLEVKQVRVNSEAADISQLAGSTGRGGVGGAFGGNVGRGNVGRGNVGRPAVGRGGEGNLDGDTGKYPWDVVVEVYGIIYIFNPPSMKRLTDTLEADEIAKFEAEVKKATSEGAASADTTAAADAPAETPAEGEEAAGEEAAGEEAAPAAETPAEEAEPGEEVPADKPPMAAEAPRPEGASAPAG